ncbi:hypothetical protein SAMN05444007_103423 [Cribrihabitans marinus]|uniref:Uncharacterized protein n=1 Tax=Cribrihabitans marinus TaxID=1227549 RepID=A0A1H6WC36_9RHOB|nr:hypothetical protein [Cribrihabitans marinus]GGH24242.1 hypothetical protein GCM10010973_10630 [Cribrihabitans marinus]SEJ14601.1 hypothetical protein SAMN05444007_103423 [Cribrihabitans marinus]
MSNLDDRQKQAFQDRLARISANAGQAAPVSGRDAKRRTRGGRAGPVKARGRIAPGAILGGILGGGVFLASKVIAHGLTLSPPGQGDVFQKTMLAIGPFGMTAAGLFVLMIGLGLRDKPHLLGICVALPVLHFGEPYLAALMPDLWTQLFSPQYVENLLIQAGLMTPPPAL